MTASTTNAPPLVPALMQPHAYPHRVDKVELLETHISWVFLTGEFAYKVKKPVDFGFLDFSSVEARRRCCRDELRLNRRLAPDIYIDVVEIRRTADGLRVGDVCDDRPVLDYAVKMRQFRQDQLASRILARDELGPALVSGLASRVAAFHNGLPPAAADSVHGTAESILHSAQENFVQISRLLTAAADHAAVEALRDWTEREFLRVCGDFHARRSHGSIRECHGDLHLGNIVLLRGALVPFDCIEFSADLRWIDVMSEVAFVMMDLIDRGAERLAWLFVSDYLEATGDYGGLGVLRFYLVYRAMVRAKVHLLRAAQCGGDARETQRLTGEFRNYVKLAERCACMNRPALVLMHGLSGCGKTSVARELVQALGAIQVRSDVERKRARGLAPLEASRSLLSAGIYDEAATEETYARLAEAAHAIAGAGYAAIVDATFLKRSQRARLRAVADALHIGATVVHVHAPLPDLHTRVAARAAQRCDPSEATSEVIDLQERTAEPILASERFVEMDVDGRSPVTRSAIERLLQFLPHEGSPWPQQAKLVLEQQRDAEPHQAE